MACMTTYNDSLVTGKSKGHSSREAKFTCSLQLSSWSYPFIRGVQLHGIVISHNPVALPPYFAVTNGLWPHDGCPPIHPWHLDQLPLPLYLGRFSSNSIWVASTDVIGDVMIRVDICNAEQGRDQAAHKLGCKAVLNCIYDIWLRWSNFTRKVFMKSMRLVIPSRFIS